MKPLRSLAALLAAAMLVTILGGIITGAGIRDQHAARGSLNELRTANDNLALVLQARLDRALGQHSLALTPADDDALAEHVHYLRELAPDDAEEDLGRLLQLDRELQRDREPDLIGTTLALDRVADDTTTPVADRLRDAETRTWWALWITGGALAALLALCLVVLRRSARVY